MAIEKWSLNAKSTAYANVRNSLIAEALGYAKMYELLHKQIWRKDKSRLAYTVVPGLETHPENGRPMAAISHWNIQSSSRSAYARDVEGDDLRFGLNQLFLMSNGELDANGKPLFDYRKPYPEGRDPHDDDGIYHDDCYIQPKMIPVRYEYDMWRAFTQILGDGDITEHGLFKKQDSKGAVVIDNVAFAEKTELRNNVSFTYTVVSVTYATGAVDNIRVHDGPINIFDQVKFGPMHEFVEPGSVETYEFDLDGFLSDAGTLITNVYTDYEAPLTSTGLISKEAAQGWIRSYSGGLVIQYVPLQVESWGDGAYNEIPGHYKVLPMMYLDTGDMVMGSRKFVHDLSDMFELIVHENQDKWMKWIKPIATIVILVISYFFPPAAGLLSVLYYTGMVLFLIGLWGDNAQLMAIGGAMMGVSNLFGGMAQSIVDHGVSTLGQEAALQAVLQTGPMAMFSSYISFAGLGGIMNIGAQLALTGYQVYGAFVSDDATVPIENVTESVTVGQKATANNSVDHQPTESLMYDPYALVEQMTSVDHFTAV